MISEKKSHIGVLFCEETIYVLEDFFGQDFHKKARETRNAYNLFGGSFILSSESDLL